MKIYSVLAFPIPDFSMQAFFKTGLSMDRMRSCNSALHQAELDILVLRAHALSATSSSTHNILIDVYTYTYTYVCSSDVCLR